MEDFERYGDYNEYEEDIPKSKNPVLRALKVTVITVCFLVVALIAFRLVLFNHYPDSIKKLHFNDTLTAYYEATGGDIGAKTQKLRAPYDDPDKAKFFCDNLIVIAGADQLQVSARFNNSLPEIIKEEYGIDIDPKNPDTFDFRLVRNNPENSNEPLVVGSLSVKLSDSAMMYEYYKLVFDEVDFGLDEGENAVNWIRLEIFLNGADSDEPIAMIPIYENNENYSSFSDYKLSAKEKP